ncbi:MAG: hypothetical protein ACRDF4_07125, partial [Rhabdochlamydiaceae bacterium]
MSAEIHHGAIIRPPAKQAPPPPVVVPQQRSFTQVHHGPISNSPTPAPSPPPRISSPPPHSTAPPPPAPKPPTSSPYIQFPTQSQQQKGYTNFSVGGQTFYLAPVNGGYQTQYNGQTYFFSSIQEAQDFGYDLANSKKGANVYSVTVGGKTTYGSQSYIQKLVNQLNTQATLNKGISNRSNRLNWSASNLNNYPINETTYYGWRGDWASNIAFSPPPLVKNNTSYYGGRSDFFSNLAFSPVLYENETSYSGARSDWASNLAFANPTNFRPSSISAIAARQAAAIILANRARGRPSGIPSWLLTGPFFSYLKTGFNDAGNFVLGASEQWWQQAEKGNAVVANTKANPVVRVGAAFGTDLAAGIA